MKFNVKSFARNFSYTLTANVISLTFNAMLVLLLPKRIDVINYAYWQLYQLYAQYIGYLTFGITDGVYLRYGGEEYGDLPKPLFRSQFWFLIGSNILMDIALLSVYWQFVTDSNRWLIVVMTCLTGVLYVPRTLITNTFQATNRIKEYAGIIIFEKLSVLAIVLVMLAMGQLSFEYYVYADVTSKLLTLVYAVVSARDLVFGALPKAYRSWQETRINISVGIKVLIANLSIILINGIVRIIIERKWGLESFGQISFSFSISNILIMVILAVSVVFFPVLKRMEKDQYARVYRGIRSKMIIPLAGLMILYFPARAVLSLWLPSYAASLQYMALLFPLALYESNMKLLGNNYLKAMRRENYLMFNNLLSVGLTILLSFLCAYYFDSLVLTVFTIFLVYAIRCIMAERYIARVLGVNTARDILLEIVLSLIFIASGWLLPVTPGMAAYGLAYLVYLYLKKEDVRVILKYVSGVVKR